MSSSAEAAPVARSNDEEFFPKGAVAFFAAMLLFFGAIWLSLYLLLLQRR